ncbi:hypothetical protein EX30DRAFT_101524 [Ascodesmis nigricans]|uniref:FAD/NAD(P)-binding domain-containing protein n=1 Tax=Ascodesmis nigricans TaxID=341454 RepID=A0A4V3SJK5_9PEZI|nr:hypothetical protein EX30DRAFT_101524 [Ascodesmis nigricans]
MDEFTLPSTEWDAVIVGTGVKLSLLACALSRAKLSVLQLDPSPHYGSNETALSLSELEEHIASLSSPTAQFKLHSTPVHRDRDYTFTLAPHLIYWNSPLLEFLRDVKMTTSFTWLPLGSWWVWLSDEAVKERGTAKSGGLEGAMANLAAGAVKAGGTVRKKAAWNKNRSKNSAPPVTGALEALAAGKPADEQPASTWGEPSTSTSAATLRRHGDLREVPCTVEDIAWSQDLEGQDRANLGRFLRFIQQSASPEPTSGESNSSASLLAQNADTPLTTFINANFPLPPATIASIHSLTLLPTPPSSTPLHLAVSRLKTHLFSLGSIAEIRSAAALTLSYGGSAELCQVWSRGAAVAGGINILSCDVTPEPLPASSSDADDRIPLKLSTHPSTPITAKHLIMELEPSSWSEESYHAIYLLSTQLPPLFQKKLSTDAVSPAAVVVTMPPDQDAKTGLGNSTPIYLQIRSSATGECARGECVIYAVTAEEKERALLKRAVEMVVEAVDPTTQTGKGSEKIVMSCEYASGDLKRVGVMKGAERRQGELEKVVSEEVREKRVVKVRPLKRDIVFDEGTVEECRAVYERIVGTREGFCEPPPEFVGHGEEDE